MRQSRRQITAQTPDYEEGELAPNENPEDFLDRNHPENDQYMKAVEHVQRQIMHQTTLLRSKQVIILKAVFAGNNFTQTGTLTHTHPNTVSRLVKSPKGQRLLNLLQYHLKLIEGPNEAQRRSMLWRIAVAEELISPNTSIKAIEALNKMHFQQEQLDQALPIGTQPQAPTVVIHIDQQILPKGVLDRG
jgi:hypothetical protein